MGEKIMFSIYDMYLLGSCAVVFITWCICILIDKGDNK